MPKIVRDEDIFRAVIRVIVLRGYAGATTKEMAEAANVSEMTLFRKYETKAQLVKLAISSIADQMDFESATQYSGDLYADLFAVVERYQNLASEYGHFLSVLMPDLGRYPEMAEVMERPMGIMRSVGMLVARYQAEGQLRVENPFHTVSALLGPLVYIPMLRGSVLDSNLPSMDLAEHVKNFLGGREVFPKD